MTFTIIAHIIINMSLGYCLNFLNVDFQTESRKQCQWNCKPEKKNTPPGVFYKNSMKL